MIRIGILGDIGAGKSYVARSFGYPVFNADKEVAQIYKNNRRVFHKLKKSLPKYINAFPISKSEICEAIIADKNNLKKIVKIVHYEVRKKLSIFIKKNQKKKIVVLDIPLLLENNINKKKDILIFVQAKKFDVEKRLLKRVNFNSKLIKKFRNIQFSLSYKKNKATFIIKNNFRKKSVKKDIKSILKKIL